MNAGGMLQECQMGAFLEGRCGPGGNHRIIIPLLLTFFLPTHTHTHTHALYTDPHTHIPVEHSPLYEHQGEKV